MCDCPRTPSPDGQGLHTRRPTHLASERSQHFEVLDPVTGRRRIRHPQRSEAYSPTLRHNGHGAWVCETENRGVARPTLMRRLGHSTEGFQR